VIAYVLRLVRSTRVREPMDGGHPRPRLVSEYVGWGAGPRASEFMVLAGKARAALEGAPTVTFEHIRRVAKPVLRHRILTNFNAEADQITTDAIVDDLLEHVPVEGTSASEARQMDSVLQRPQ